MMPRLRARLLRRAASPAFQTWAARFPLTRGRVRREGEAMFDLVSGFVQTQMLRALIELDVLNYLIDAPRTATELAPDVSLTPDRAELVFRAGVAMGLLSLGRRGYRTTLRGAALAGVPGLPDMIRHHEVLYRDLSDPVAFLRDETDPELARFWPYVFGGGAGAEEAARYSRLMAESQDMVAAETLDQLDLSGVERLLDVGGGTGRFLSHVHTRYPNLQLTLMDLPEVLAGVTDPLREALDLVGRSFRNGPLPEGHDAITLIRVCYDHADETVLDLMQRIRAALPEGGRLIVSEPMTGGDRPTRPGDVYFALYCAAMGTGRARSPEQIAALMRQAGFVKTECLKPRRAFVTSVVVGIR
ncbi:methyltransferase [Palleronia caenipelagi]|uniref:Methyltransferase domain-containing protein n=1 Tax=Palleronia caenipelagi TaxID=2489174 RepID=A0A547Q7N0_9RHOB|nr:methyltransferase [Palleronia caenipelagi]TRD22397.1 methyltransferase domain-containing protein [Palleronia caenipelagi]